MFVCMFKEFMINKVEKGIVPVTYRIVYVRTRISGG